MPDAASHHEAFDNRTLSVILRFHAEERLPFLSEAIFSLAVQDWPEIEVAVIVQNGTAELVQRVAALVENQPWTAPPRVQILPVAVAPGVDGRSKLLNHGIRQTTGRFLAFLDDDDVVYQHGYASLIGMLLNGERALAVGGCRAASATLVAGHWYTTKKDLPFAWGKNRFDLFRDNFIPIHSYVIDRARLRSADLYFDETMTVLEDYDFLLRLGARYAPDFALIDVPVCEYRRRLDGSNTIPYSDAPHAVLTPAHQQALDIIRKRKEELVCQVTAGELAQMAETLAALSEERERESGQLPFILARHISRRSGQHPRLAARLRAAWLLLRKIYRRG